MTYTSTVLADGAYALWAMDGAGSTEPNVATGTRVLTYTGSGVTHQVSGLISESSAAQFNGSTGGASGPLDLSDASAVTIEAWVKWVAYNSSDDDLLMEFTSNFGANNGGFIVNMHNSTGGAEAATISIGFTESDGTPRRVTIPQSALPAGNAHHLAIILDLTNGAAGVTVYVDGVSVPATVRQGASLSDGGTTGFANSTLYLASRAVSALFGACTLQKVSVTKAALTSTQIAAHFAAGAGSFTPQAASDAATAADAGGVILTGARDSTSIRRIG